MYPGRGKLDPFTNSASPSLLDQELQEKLAALKERCLHGGIGLKVGTTVRGPGAQAKLWCASKTVGHVLVTKESLAKAAPRIASFLSDSYIRPNAPPCDELPGNSWHQFFTAVDVYPMLDGEVVLRSSLTKHVAKLAGALGLRNVPLYGIKAVGRIHHLQLSEYQDPLSDRDFAGTWTNLDILMGEMYDI